MIRFLYFAVCLILVCELGPMRVKAADAAPYDQMLANGQKLLKDGQLSEAFASASAAMKLDDKRWEAYGLIALVLNAQGLSAGAKANLEKALARAPEEKKAMLRRIEDKISQQASAQPPPSSPPKDPQLSREDRRKLDAVQLILDDADSAKQASDRLRLLNEFLEKSADLAKANPSQTNLWILRAASALEANKAKEAREAGNMLITLGVDTSDDPKTRKLLAMLERKGWLGTNSTFGFSNGATKSGALRENSLGMKFVPVPGTEVLFSIWDTRVQDYQAFVDATSRSWEKPGFQQGPTHPAVMVSWDDAKAFCLWLTEKERASGTLNSTESYRLPMDKEWRAAVGENKYPWGDQWPPPLEAGNYAESLHVDSFSRTSPVGSFAANQYGLFDLGGNVWQWCEDYYRKEMNSDETRREVSWSNDDGGGQQYRVLRGGAWGNSAPVYLSSAYRDRNHPRVRIDIFGFRCVLAAGGGSR